LQKQKLILRIWLFILFRLQKPAFDAAQNKKPLFEQLLLLP
jgi:hypothetical protein